MHNEYAIMLGWKLPPFQREGRVPRFVRCQTVFKTQNQLRFAHWVDHPVQDPELKFPVIVTFIFYPLEWDPLVYVSSQAALFSNLGPGAATSPAAAAGSSAADTGASSSAATTGGSSRAGSGAQDSNAIVCGPVTIHAQIPYDGKISLPTPGVSLASLRSIIPDYEEGAYAVVLQEQVGCMMP